MHKNISALCTFSETYKGSVVSKRGRKVVVGQWKQAATKPLIPKWFGSNLGQTHDESRN